MNSTTETPVPKKFGRRYPWDDWFARGSFAVTRGHEFDGEPYSFAQIIRRAANARDIKIKISTRGDRLEVTVTSGEEDAPTTPT